MNHLTITGNLGKDPTTRYTPNGKKVCSFSVASNRHWNDGEGERHEETTWFNVEAWNGLGEVCQKYLAKGRRVLVEGRLTIRPYTAQDEQQRTWVAVVASNVEFLDAPRNQEQTPAPEEEQIPF